MIIKKSSSKDAGYTRTMLYYMYVSVNINEWRFDNFGHLVTSLAQFEIGTIFVFVVVSFLDNRGQLIHVI